MRRIILCVCVFLSFFVTANANVAKPENTLLVLPDDGMTSISQSIDSAKTEIDVVMYAFTNQALANDLIRASQRGVNVKLMIEPHPYKNEDENKPVLKSLRAAGVQVRYSNPHFQLTHQKTLIVDNKAAFVMTFNFSNLNKYARNFAIQTSEPKAVAEIKKAFDADWSRQHFAITSGSDLVWSPNDSQKDIKTLIASAKRRLWVYNQEFGSGSMLRALERQAKKGVQVRLIVPQTQYATFKTDLDAAARHGIQVRLQSRLYTHAKAVLVDPGSPHARALVGSMNFTYSGLNLNRELGMQVSDKAVTDRLKQIFSQDWSRAQRLTLHTSVHKAHHSVKSSCSETECYIKMPG